MRTKLHNGLTAAVLVLALLLGTQVPISAQFSAQIQIALQTLGIWPYDGSYGNGDFPVWSTASNKFLPSSAGPGPVLVGPTFTGQIKGPDTANCSAPSYSYTSDPDTGMTHINTNRNTMCGGGTAVAEWGNGAVTLAAASLLQWSSTSDPAATADLIFAREAANHWFQRNSTNAQRASWANTYTSSTNYEAFSVDWQTLANIGIVGTRTAASGTQRPLRLVSQQSGGANAYAMIDLGTYPIGFWDVASGTLGAINRTDTGNWLQIGGSSTSTTTSATGIKFVAILPTYNQASGSAANTDLLINRTQTAVGSGAQLLIDAQVGGSSQFSVSNVGVVTTAGAILSGADVRAASNSLFYWASRSVLGSTANALINATDNGGTFGIQFNTGTAAPTVTSCGTGTVTTGSRNTVGQITATGASTCTITFGAPAWTNAPKCTITANAAPTTVPYINGDPTTTAFIVAGMTSGDNLKFSYICMGRI